MKNAAKTTACGITALILLACGADNGTAPDKTVLGKSEDPTTQTTCSAPQVSAEDEAYIEGILNAANPISNMITVEPSICAENPDYPDDSWWCLPNRTRLESGNVLHNWDGYNESIYCETEQDTIWYSVSLHNNIITKKWRNPLFTADDINKAEFRDSCITEGGEITEDTEDQVICQLQIKPLNTDKEYTPPAEGELSLEFDFNYHDPNWKLFATKAISPCRVHPVYSE